MKLSVCSIAWRDKPVDHVFRMMAELGYRNADLFASNSTGHAFRTLDPPARDRIRRLGERHGIAIVSLAGAVGDGFTAEREADRETELERVRAEIDLAADLGASVARIAPGAGTDPGPIMTRALPYLRRAADYAEQKGLRLGMENHTGSITANPDQIAALCRAAGSRALGVIYDPGNLFGALVDYKKGFETMRDFILHVHLKDGFPHYFGNDGFAPQRLSCTLFGEGQLDIPWIMDRLAAIGYAGYVSAEFESWHPEYHLPVADEGLGQVRRYMERWFASCRGPLL